ncbi:unnamed protein product, partial [Didymodactylos carnosus]
KKCPLWAVTQLPAHYVIIENLIQSSKQHFEDTKSMINDHKEHLDNHMRIMDKHKEQFDSHMKSIDKHHQTFKLTYSILGLFIIVLLLVLLIILSCLCKKYIHCKDLSHAQRFLDLIRFNIQQQAPAQRSNTTQDIATIDNHALTRDLSNAFA